MKTLSSSNSRIGEDNSLEEIPLDLIIEILLKLPAKSIARFRCVAKLWDSTVRSPNFTDSYFAISSSRPKLLFSCFKDGKTFFFSSVSPQHKVSSRNLSPIVANFHMKVPFDKCPPVRGLVCGLLQEGETVTVPLICNPSTGQSLTLPTLKTERNEVMISYLGYDPIDKQFKVLCMTLSGIDTDEHQVLTLGKELSWRMIKCDIPHCPIIYYKGMCINGVCYYFASIRRSNRFLDIACFDIRSEKFKCIRQPYDMVCSSYMICIFDDFYVNHYA